MTHDLGRDPAADARWLTFLQDPMLSYAERRECFNRGFRPDQPASFSCLANWLNDDRLAQLSLRLDQAKPDRPPKWALTYNLCVIPYGSDLYPAQLAWCQDAPPALFCMGDPARLSRPAVAIVGTRHPSREGVTLAETVSAELASAGLSVVSGLARGIDGCAHKAALAASGQTVAVMATGFDRIYPGEHRAIAEQIARDGALVSEFLPGCAPERWHFPRRNRTISGLSLAVVVVEAGRPSGTLITANAALDQGREVFVCPWSIFHRAGAGCLHLLQQGARLLTSTLDIVLELGAALEGQLAVSVSSSGSLHGPTGHPNGGDLSTEGHKLLQALGDGEISLNDLAVATALPVADVAAEISRLELAGRVYATALGYRKRHPSSTPAFLPSAL